MRLKLAWAGHAMSDNARNVEHVVPFLTQFAVPRVGDARIPGRYDQKMQVWVIDTPTGPNPIISSANSLSELTTKTDVIRERDDPGSCNLLELGTKTSVVPERDDFRIPTLAFEVSLETTTKASGERTDFDTDCYQ